MGAGCSSADYVDGAHHDSEIRPRLGDIPESCIALILAYLDPPEICKLASLNRAFRRASTADFIWDVKSPPNCRFIVEKLFDEKMLLGVCKKDVFARLCRPNSFDGGTKELWLDKKSGGVCLSISSKALSITGIDDRRYWSYIPTEESRFKAVAYLHQIWWFEVGGELEFNFPAGTYTLLFRLQLGKPSKKRGHRICDLAHIHGWDIRPVRFQLTTSDGQHAVSQCYLDHPGSWVLYHGGDFVVEDSKKITNIKFSAMQIDCTHIKCGLCIDSVLIYPTSIAKEIRSIF
ncbi:hypothetical protein Nepgr_020108 [Nepenthes gracilis]|uniref:F-box domain-containing protein n=1 Tax=Nepenthes gracilis TaxID=150966 RepID=A0AAD3XUQ3_NEPGR|nr:hypothetical protein Nepgr_020108 [Nepenthes gracilis]